MFISVIFIHEIFFYKPDLKIIRIHIFFIFKIYSKKSNWKYEKKSSIFSLEELIFARPLKTNKKYRKYKFNKF